MKDMLQEPLTQSSASLKVLIIGAGPAGLLTALECKRLGFNPVVLERSEQADSAGDFFVIGPSASKTFSHWPQLQADFQADFPTCQCFYSRHTGEQIAGPFPFPEWAGRPIIRRKFHSMLERAVHREDISIKYSHKVVSYFEDDTLAGVRLASGQEITADLVVACDGVHSKSSLVIKGVEPKSISSGQAVFRTSVPMSEVFAADASLEDVFACKDGMPYMRWYSGPRSHALIFAYDGWICWSIHHPENANTSSESWSAAVDGDTVADQVLQQHPEWDRTLISLIRNTKGKTINDWLLLSRDPEPCWVSPHGRVVQCGDSAHPFLPTSANGATQAIEDAISLAAALREGVQNAASVKEALAVYNEIRFERTSCAQLSGFVTRQKHHMTDWDDVRRNPDKVRNIGPGKWIGYHDPEAYIAGNFKACLECIREGKSFKNSNTPPGYAYRPWSCLEILQNDKAGIKLELEGSWQ